MFTNFNNDDNKNEVFEVIKKFIFDVFEDVYKNGIEYFLKEDLKTENINQNNINILTK